MAWPSHADLLVKINHTRFTPIKRRFNYKSYYRWTSLQKLEDVTTHPFGFSYNRFNFLSIYDKDYGPPDDAGSIEEKIHMFYRRKSRAIPDDIFLMTCPKIFGMVFNPVHFYLGLRKGELKDMVVEINNTFGERHQYFVDLAEDPQHKKAFHVSPFFDSKGSYVYRVMLNEENFSISIDYIKHKKKLFNATISGKFKDKHSPNLFRKLLPLLNYTRIVHQASLLFYKYKMRVTTKPRPESTDTIKKASPNLLERISMFFVLKIFKSISKGKLIVVFPDDSEMQFGDALQKVASELHIHAYSLFPQLLMGGDIAFGVGFEEKAWDSPDLLALLRLMAKNIEALEKKNFVFRALIKNFYTAIHRRRTNTLSGSKKNIQSHYDLGNDFFDKILDPSMNYSSGIFAQSSDTLEQAQVQKINRILKQLQLKSSDHVLDIGSGWGAMAIALSKCVRKATTLTLSEKQAAWVKARIKTEKIQNVDIELKDYRNMDAKFDGLVSIEMIEAVGKEFLEGYFQKASTLLVPGGRFVLQGITMADFKFRSYERGVDWIQMHVFPGSFIPTKTLIESHAQAHGFEIENVFEMGLDYAKTLECWKDQLSSNWQALMSLGYPESLLRRFLYYLLYCQAGFLEEHTHVSQWTLINHSGDHT